MATDIKGDRTNVNIARGLLYKDHIEGTKNLSNIFSKPIKPSQVKNAMNRVNRVTRNLNADVRATIMTSIDTAISETISKQNAWLKLNGFPPLTELEQERLRNQAIAKSLGTFKGATLEKRLDVSKRLANKRLRQEITLSDTKKGVEESRKRALAFMTDNRETGRSLIGGSNYKYNERILVSEYNRAKQEASREIMKELGLLGRWTLNSRHKIYDICDEFAEKTGEQASKLLASLNVSIFELDPRGVYTADELPDYPHPYCQCSIEPVLTDYGISLIKEKVIWEGIGETMVPYNDAMISEESHKYYEEWLKREYEIVRPYDAERRTAEEIEKKLASIKRKTTAGIEGTVELRNKPLEKYVRAGGIRAYEEVAKNTVGYALDPEIVEKIGVDNAVKLLARDIKNGENLEEIIKALEKYNTERLPIAMRKSLAEARKAMNLADSYRLQVKAGTPKRAVQGLRTKALIKARTELGDAIGYAEIHERLLRELKSPKDIKFINIEFKDKKVLSNLQNILGLKEFDYKVLKKGGKQYLAIGDKGIESLSKWYEGKDKLKLSEELERIRLGKANKKGWIPAMFKKEFTDKSTGKVMPFELRPDQQTGIRFAKENEYALFHFKPGSGKTHTAMGTITELAHEGKVKKSLVVVPNDLVRQFKDEIEEFTEGVTVRAMTYQTKAQRLKEYSGDQLITIISHNQLKNDIDALKKAGFDLVVVDEIHQLNKDMFKALGDMKTRYRIGMTGTAIKDSITDMYDILDWLSPTGMPAKYKFESKFKDITKASSFYQESVLRDLRDTLKPMVLTKDSPVKAKLVPINRRIRLSSEQVEQIKDIELKALARMDRGASKKSVEAWRDRQLGKVVNAGEPDTNLKLAEVKKLVEKHKGEKVIIFASDRDAMKTLQKGLGDKAGYYTTELTKAQRDKLIKEFRSSPDLNILVLSDAGATGLNLEVSNVAIHWDLPDQYYKLEQRMARNWRGLKTDTTYQYLFQTNTTYDSRIKASLDKSKQIMESAKIAESLDESGLAKTIKKMLRR